jgi:hypothetical protein
MSGPTGATADDRVGALARKLLRSPAENGLEPGDLESALLIARRQLEDSEDRVHDPAAYDPEHDEAIRRTSRETSSTGDTMVRRSSTGE